MGRRVSVSRYIAILAAIVSSFVYFGIKPFLHARNIPPNNEFAYVSRVIDGDTLKLSTGERVRLIGVDTPELHYSEKLLRDARRSHKDTKEIQLLGKKAADFTRSLCQGKRIRLEYDHQNRDKYGRLLAYVYLDDGTFVNAKILEEGFGQIMTIPPNVKYSDRFLKLERSARKSGKGLWSEM